MNSKIKLLAEQFGEIQKIKLNGTLYKNGDSKFDTILDLIEMCPIKHFWMACTDGVVSIYVITSQKYKDELWPKGIVSDTTNDIEEKQ